MILWICLLAVFLSPCVAAPPKPDTGFRWRGVLEGFYGRPWTWEQRRRMVAWMSRRRLNLFVMAAKDEDLQRGHWRRPLSAFESAELGRLQQEARRGSVELGWELSPWDARLSQSSDIEAAVSKFDSIYRLGIRKLVLAFDDTPPVREQIDFSNKVLACLIQRHPDIEMTFVPAEYWGDAAPSAYLDYVARNLDPRFRVGWTGGQVLSRAITDIQAQKFRSYIKHAVILGDNYPVQDRLIDSGRVFLGPLIGRDPGLVSSQEGYLANASPLPEISKIALYTSADFAQDPAHYDPARSWEESIKEAGGSRWLRLMAAGNSVTWLNSAKVRGSGELQETIEKYWLDGKQERLVYKLKELSHLSEGLALELRERPELLRELEPWTRKIVATARLSLKALDLLNKHASDSKDRRELALHLKALRRQEKNQASVADGALERFLNGASAILENRSRPIPQSLIPLIGSACSGQPETEPLLVGKLDEFIASAAAANDLNPWPTVLAISAGRARAALKSASWWTRSTWPLNDLSTRWRARWAFINLLASRRLMENFLGETEASLGLARGKPKSLPWTLRILLKGQKFIYSRAFPALLSRRLEAYRRTGYDADLAAAFESMIERAAEMRVAGGPEEMEPWLYKIEDYGTLGLKALEYRDRLAKVGRISEAEKIAWERDRERLASNNGLELCLELRQALEAFVRWRRRPQDQRPPCPDLTLPANPAEI